MIRSIFSKIKRRLTQDKLSQYRRNYFQSVDHASSNEILKKPSRTDIINLLVERFGSECSYLEIGVRNPDDNFNKVNATQKYSVDPGTEFKANPVDFKMTSDDFFRKLNAGEILTKEIRFDVIFIDGLHLAEQVDKDIRNALSYLSEKGFIVLHDCNPPTEWHAREEFVQGSQEAWNGTTWKAFAKWRANEKIFSCCVDTDWGVGIISKRVNIGKSSNIDLEFYEYQKLAKRRKEVLGLVTFKEFRKSLN